MHGATAGENYPFLGRLVVGSASALPRTGFDRFSRRCRCGEAARFRVEGEDPLRRCADSVVCLSVR